MLGSSRQAILEAARDFITESDFNAMTIEAIAVRAGVTKQLVVSTRARRGQEVARPNDAGFDGTTTRQYLRLWGRHHPAERVWLSSRSSSSSRPKPGRQRRLKHQGRSDPGTGTDGTPGNAKTLPGSNDSQPASSHPIPALSILVTLYESSFNHRLRTPSGQPQDRHYPRVSAVTLDNCCLLCLAWTGVHLVAHTTGGRFVHGRGRLRRHRLRDVHSLLEGLLHAIRDHLRVAVDLVERQVPVAMQGRGGRLGLRDLLTAGSDEAGNRNDVGEVLIVVPLVEFFFAGFDRVGVDDEYRNCHEISFGVGCVVPPSGGPSVPASGQSPVPAAFAFADVKTPWGRLGAQAWMKPISVPTG